MTTTTTFRTMADVRRANKAIGNHWFERDTMRFFDSRVESTLYGGRYFITSEQFHGSQGSLPRRFTLRRVEPDGSIEDESAFQAYSTIELARVAARIATHQPTTRSEQARAQWDAHRSAKAASR